MTSWLWRQPDFYAPRGEPVETSQTLNINLNSPQNYSQQATEMACNRKDTDKKGKSSKKEEQPNPKEEGGEGLMAAVLAELRILRKEHAEASKDTKDSLARVEAALTEADERITKLEQRTTDYEQRLSEAEDKSRRNERTLRHLLQREAILSAKCEDLESRARRNNVRIYGVKEDEETNKDMLRFINDIIRTSLTLPEELKLNIERAHRSLVMKPKDAASPPRSIIVRFLDYRTKEAVIQEAWKHRGGVSYNGQKIFFDQDYTSDIQKKRKQVRDVIKLLKEKNIKAQSPFPAKLRIHLKTGPKTFTTLADAAATLGELGVQVHLNEREALQANLLKNKWTDASTSTGANSMTNADLKSILHGGPR